MSLPTVSPVLTATTQVLAVSANNLLVYDDVKAPTVTSISPTSAPIPNKSVFDTVGIGRRRTVETIDKPRFVGDWGWNQQ